MSNTDRIQSTKTAFRVLDHIANSRGVSVAGLDEMMEISRTSIYKHLRTLEDVNAVENREGRFYIGPKFSEYIRARNPGITDHVQRSQIIDDLSLSLDAPVNLWVRAEDICECIYSSLPNEGRENPRHQGENNLLVESCPGKTIFAHLPQADQNAVLDNYEEGTESAQFHEQIQTIQDRKVLIESLKPEADWVSISTPVFGKSAYPQGALEVVIPSERGRGIDIEVNITGLLLDTATNFDIESM